MDTMCAGGCNIVKGRMLHWIRLYVLSKRKKHISNIALYAANDVPTIPRGIISCMSGLRLSV